MPDEPTPNEIPDVIKVPSVVSAAGRWLFGQEANTVAMFALLGMIAFAFAKGVPYLVSVGREMHKEATDSIEHIVTNQHELTKQLADQHRDERKEAWKQLGEIKAEMRSQSRDIRDASKSVEALTAELHETNKHLLREAAPKPAKGSP